MVYKLGEDELHRAPVVALKKFFQKFLNSELKLLKKTSQKNEKISRESSLRSLVS